jgi:hypothetical protein
LVGTPQRLKYFLNDFSPRNTKIILLTNTNDSLTISRYIDSEFKIYFSYATDSQLVNIGNPGKTNISKLPISTQFQLQTLTTRLETKTPNTAFLVTRSGFYTTDLIGTTISKIPDTSIFVNESALSTALDTYLKDSNEYIFSRIFFDSTTINDLQVYGGVRVISTEGGLENLISYLRPLGYITTATYDPLSTLYTITVNDTKYGSFSFSALEQTLNAVGLSVDKTTNIVNYNIEDVLLQLVQNSVNAILNPDLK